MTPEDLLVAATALHLGFQVVVTVLVYPALAEVGPAQWAAAHGRHMHRILPLVLVVYGLVVLSGVLIFARDPSSLQVLAVLAGAGAILVTAFFASPLHPRLEADGPDPVLLGRLLLVDRLRCLLVAAATALAAMASLST